MRAIDFFCGGGGMTRGLLNAGINVVAGIDVCPDYRDTYVNNNQVPFVAKSIVDITETDILNVLPDIQTATDTLFVGCAPCQPFSQQRKSVSEHKDKFLLSAFGTMIEQYKPCYVLIENVPGIRGKGKEVFQSFLDLLKRNKYDYRTEVINAKKYGVPQNRNRLVLIASRVTKAILPEPICDGSEDHPYRTVADALRHFPPIIAGQSYDGIPNHKAATLSELNMQRIMATPHDGGSRTSWPTELVLKCHKAKDAGHTDVYGRMAWEKIAPTLTSKCCSISNGRFGHPDQNRAISFREAAALQSFPDDYVFYGKSDAIISRQIGNAVPVLLAEAIGHALIQMEQNAIETKE